MRKRVNITPIKKNTGGISVVQLATYTSPKVVEVKSQEWVSYGEDNNYFGYLQDRINGSPTNNAIVNGISQMIFGKGLDATDAKQKPLEFAKAKQLLDQAEISYEEIVLGTDATSVSLKAISGQATVPQVFVDGEHIGDSEALIEWLNASQTKAA